MENCLITHMNEIPMHMPNGVLVGWVGCMGCKESEYIIKGA